MPGLITFKPIHADLDHDRTLLGTLKPYCQVTVGKQKAKTPPCKIGGANPEWGNSVTLYREEHPFAILELKDKTTLLSTTIGECKIDLEEVERAGNLTKWYAIFNKRKLVGQIKIEMILDDSLQTSRPALMDLNLAHQPEEFYRNLII